MLNKSLALGLLAFGLMVAPATAFAGQSQGNVQRTGQNGAATDGSTTAQTSESINNQAQAQVNKARRGIAYGRYRRNYPVHSTPQSQHSAQNTVQNGAATDGSTTAQSSNTHNNQTQAASSRRGY
ncbi:MAG: hypothetical protein PUP92_03495 [Rhizonema sp. PD38]|nr:hypothetical protein [Rhizonema sp. PD38]